MHIKIDMSGKIEDSRQNTIIAFSNSISKTIFIDRREKRKLELFARKNNIPQLYIIKSFSALIFLLIQYHLDKIRSIEIDKEYSRKEKLIKDYLLSHIRKHRSFDPRDIQFSHIGKKVNAHKIAIATLRKQLKPDIIVNSQDVENLL